MIEFNTKVKTVGELKSILEGYDDKTEICIVSAKNPIMFGGPLHISDVEGVLFVSNRD